MELAILSSLVVSLFYNIFRFIILSNIVAKMFSSFELNIFHNGGYPINDYVGVLISSILGAS